MPKGDIVLIPFPFTNLSGKKLRPALVLKDSSLDVTVAFITTQVNWQEPTDILIKPAATNGIKKTSLIRISKLATIDKQLIIGKIGTIDNKTILEVNKKLKLIFQL